MSIKTKNLAGLGFLFLAGCTQLHHVQIGEINQSQGSLTPFSIRVSELGFDAAESAGIASEIVQNQSTSEDLELVSLILALSNTGPVTGNPVYNDAYADKILSDVTKACPSKKITGLTSVREATTVGPVSGEVVRINGYCIN